MERHSRTLEIHTHTHMNITIHRRGEIISLTNLDSNIKVWEIMNMLQIKPNERLIYKGRFPSLEYSLKEQCIKSKSILSCEQGVGLIFSGSMVMAKIFQFNLFSQKQNVIIDKVATNGYWSIKKEDSFENWHHDTYEWRNCNDLFYFCDSIHSFQKTFISKKKVSTHDTIDIHFNTMASFPQHFIHLATASEYIVSLSKQESGILYPAEPFIRVEWKHKENAYLCIKPLLQGNQWYLLTIDTPCGLTHYAKIKILFQTEHVPCFANMNMVNKASKFANILIVH
jgi:hypothetical protein